MKIFEVDFDSPSELKKLITQLQKRRKSILRKLGYNQIYFNGNKYNLDTLIPAFHKIYDTDNTCLYENTDNINDYYVYFHCNPLLGLDVKNNIKHLFLALKYPNLKHVPFYVGKGKGNRYLDLSRNGNHRKVRQQLIQFKKDIVPIVIESDLTESQSLSKESALIDILGLQCYSKHGMLVNLDEGDNSKFRHQSYLDDDKLIYKILKANGFNLNK